MHRKPANLRGAVDAEDWNVIAILLERHALATESTDLTAALFQAAAAYRLVAVQQELVLTQERVGNLLSRLVDTIGQGQ